MKTDKQVDNLIAKIFEEHLKVYGFTEIDSELVKIVLRLTYRFGSRDGYDECYKTIIEQLKTKKL